MRIAVFGLGYVGSVMAGALSRDGHRVIGVDVNESRVASINDGRCPVTEPGLAELFAEGVAEGRLRATTDAGAAVAAAELCWICVGTPSRADGLLDTTAVQAVCTEIGSLLAEMPAHTPTVAIRSTLPPGTAARLLDVLTQRAGRPVPLCVAPEFLREGCALSDYDEPALVVVGTPDPTWADKVRAVLPEGRWFTCGMEEAELLKAACNAWHATKVSFANEVARLGHAVGADPRRVMELLVADDRLNTSARYLRPGFAFGGSCLPKDLAALNHLGRHHHLSLPLLSGVASSNEAHIDAARRAIETHAHQRVAFIGLAFKPRTDDLRHSPFVTLVEYALGRGLGVQVWDPGVRAERLVGTNLDFAQRRLGHLARLLVAESSALEADLYVLGHATEQSLALVGALPAEAMVLDLTGSALRTAAAVVGLAWPADP